AARCSGLLAPLYQLAALRPWQRLIAATLAVEALGLRPGQDVGLDAVDAHAAVRLIDADHLHRALGAPVPILPARADLGVLLRCGEHIGRNITAGVILPVTPGLAPGVLCSVRNRHIGAFKA